jgi:hypothetical protein
MQKIVAAAAVGLLALTAASYAQDEKMYLTTQGGKSMVMGGGTTEGSEVLVGTGAKPADCPAGQYYMTDASQQMVMACDTDAAFSLAAPANGEMMANGEAYPEGSMIMTPQ